MSQSHDNLSNLLISCMSVGEVVTPDRVTRSAGKDPSHIILYLLLLYSLSLRMQDATTALALGSVGVGL